MHTTFKRLFVIAILAGAIGLLLMPVIAYAYNKTIGNNSTDCMIEYVNGAFPLWEVYTFEDGTFHIDSQGLENEFMQSIGTVDGCSMKWVPFIVGAINVPYCHTTRVMEQLIN